MRIKQSAKSYHVGLNHAVAHLVMKKKGLDEIYSFDRDFDQFKDMKRVSR